MEGFKGERMANKSSATTTKRKSTSSSSGSRSSSSRNSSGRSSSSRGGSSRSTSNSRRTPNKNTKAYAKQREIERAEAATPPENLREIYAIIMFAVNLLLILGTFGVCGKVGKMVSGFFFGLFGVTFYVLPVFSFVSFCLIIVNGPKPKLIKKLVWIFVLIMTIGFVCQLVVGTKGYDFKDLYFGGYTDHAGGGLFFGGLIVLIAKLISRVGAVIVTVLLMIIAFIMITNFRLADIGSAIFALSERLPYDDDDEYDDDDYDEEDDEDDEDIRRIMGRGDRMLRNSGRTNKRERDLLTDITVLDTEEKVLKSGKDMGDDSHNSGSETQSSKRASRNKTVPSEEVHEINSDNTPDYNSDIDNLIISNGSVMDDEDAGDFSGFNDTLAERSSSGSTPGSGSSRSGSGRGRASSQRGDLYELEVDPSTYVDPLGDNNTQNTVQSTYAGPRKRSGGADSANRNVFSSPTAPVETNNSSAPVEPAEKVTQQDKAEATKQISDEISKSEEPKKVYHFPPAKLLKSGGRSSFDNSNNDTIRETARTLKSALESFGVKVTITNCSVGPSITRYELQPEQGVRVNKIVSLENDIKMALAAADVRIEAPIPGKSAIGIEVPNKDNQPVYFRDLIDNDLFKKFKSNVAFAVGKDISGQIVISDIAKMPHLLIAGATGSGKSVCINTLIMSILYKSSPEDVRMIMVDPKMVELTVYNGIPHLLIPVVTDPKKAAGALNWAVDEMTKRYQLFANYNVRNMEGFNKKVEELGPNEDPQFKHMYQLIVIVDELADLMMVAHKEVEDSIVRLSQLARAAGIHLVIATQRPSVDVITGLIKANVPSRIAFSVSSGVDSRTIIDMVGAEKLLGKGDMLFYPTGYTKPVRVQGAFISDEEVVSVVEYIKDKSGETTYDDNISKSIESSNVGDGGGSSGGLSADDNNKYDELFEDAARFVIDKDKASIGYLQRMLRIGFNRAARIMDQMEEYGIVGPEEGTKPRKILMNMSEFEEKWYAD